MTRSAAVALLFWSSLAFAQTAEKIDVSVTNIDVIVTDASGQPVHGLTPADFEVVEGRSRQQVTNLVEMTTIPETPAAAQPPARSVLLFFDNNTLTLANRKTGAEAVRNWISTLRPNDAVAVVTAVPSLQLKLPWTTDKAAIQAAIDGAASETGPSGEQARRQAEERVQNVVARAASASRGEIVKFDEATQAVRVYAEMTKRSVLATASSITAALSYFPRRGRKNVLLIVGEGLNPQPGSEMFQFLNSIKMDIESGAGPAMLKSGASEASPLTEASSYDVSPALQKVTSLAIRSGVMIYAINPGMNESSGGQVQAGSPVDTRAEFARAAAARSGYEMLVGKSGGRAFFGMPPAKAMDSVSSDLGSYYSMGYRSAAKPDPEKLVVRSRPGYRVRVTRTAIPQAPEVMMKETVLANHMTPPISNDLKIALAADPAVPQGEGRKVQLRVLIPIDRLQLDREGEEVVGSFSVYVSSGDDKGSATEVNRQTKEVRFPAAALTQVKGKTIGFAVEVLVPKGLTQISVGVMDERSQATGFERLTIGG